MARVMLRVLNQRLSAWLQRSDTRYELSLVAFTLVVRIVTSGMQTGPDPNQKWGFVRQMLAGGFPSAAEFNHHHARWGVHVALLIVQTLFGSHAACIAIAPISFAIIQSLLLYHIGKRLNGPVAGILAAVFTNLLPSSGSMLSTVQTLAFERVYLLLTFYALMRSADVRHSRWLALSCFSAFFAYLAKETTVFALPGIAYYAWISRQRFRDAVILAGSFVALFLTETLIYRIVFGFSQGRATIIRRHHMGVPKLSVPMKFWQLFERYTRLEPVLDFLFYAALVASLCVPFWYRYKRREPVPSLLKGTLAATWAFYFLTTFALKSIDPLLPAQPPLARYLLPGVPFLALVVGWAAVEWGERFVQPLKAKLNPQAILVAIPLVAALGVVIIKHPKWSELGIAKTAKLEADVQKAFLNGDPVIVKEKKPPIRNFERSVRFLYLTYEQAQHMLVINGSPRVRAIVDRRRPEFKRPAAELSKLVSGWEKVAQPLLDKKSFAVARIHSRDRSSKAAEKGRRNKAK